MNFFKRVFIKKSLIFLNIIILFIISFEVGGRFAKAQIVYFDEPQDAVPVVNSLSQEDINSLLNRPITEQYQEFKDQISASVSPEHPGPGQTTSISLEVYSFDINSAEITWKVNGKVERKGLGIKQFNFKNGEVGKTTTVEVQIDPLDRPIVTKTFTFKPGEVDLLWQADVYTHPFYRGKNLYTPESNLIFVAMPQTTSGNIDPSKTIFNWTINDSKQADKSGFGRDTYLFQGPIIVRPVEVSVETYFPNKNASDPKTIASKDLVVNPQSSGLLFYENSPLYGVLFNRALIGNINIEKEEMSVSAYPYFQTITNKNSGPNYRWVVDGYPVNINESKNSLTLRKTQGDYGESTIASQSQNPLKILQTAQTQVILKFDKSTYDQNLSGTPSDFGR